MAGTGARALSMDERSRSIYQPSIRQSRARRTSWPHHGDTLFYPDGIPDDRCVEGMITAIRLSDQCARRVVGAEVTIHGGLMRIGGVERLVSRGFPW
jgi:hypothetical protein